MDTVNVETVGDGTHVVRVAGSISFSSNQAFKDALDGVLESDPQRLLLDFSEVNFCNSQGFGDMLRAYTRMLKAGGRFGLISPTPEIRKVLEITKFARIIDIYVSMEDALGADQAG